MSIFSDIYHGATKILHNVTDAVVNPVSLIKNSLLVGPLGAQGAASISGSAATVKEAAALTVLGTGAIYGGSLLLGPNLGVTPAIAGGGAGVVAAGGAPAAVAGTTVATTALPPAVANTSLFDSAANYFGLGKALGTISNPGVSGDTTGGGTATVNTGATAASPINWPIILGIGGVLVFIWLMLIRR